MQLYAADGDEARAMNYSGKTLICYVTFFSIGSYGSLWECKAL